jgi:hypothetical protein
VGINKLIEEMTKKDNPADIESVYKELKKYIMWREARNHNVDTILLYNSILFAFALLGPFKKVQEIEMMEHQHSILRLKAAHIESILRFHFSGSIFQKV